MSPQEDELHAIQGYSAGNNPLEIAYMIGSVRARFPNDRKSPGWTLCFTTFNAPASLRVGVRNCVSPRFAHNAQA